jgi:hypothetical protein
MKRTVTTMLVLFLLGHVQGQLSNAILWRLSGNGIPPGSYVFLAGPGCDASLKLTPKVKEALKEAKAIAMDFNLYDSKDASRFQSYSAAGADTQSVRQNLSTAEFQLFANNLKNNGVPDQMVQTLYSYKIAMAYYMTAMMNNPCGSGKLPPSYETLLKPYARKNSLEYLVFQNVDDYLAEDNSHSNDYWRRNVRYAIGDENAFRNGLLTEMRYYEKEDLQQLQKLYASDRLYLLRYGDRIVRDHAVYLAGKIDAQAKKEPTFIAIQVYNIVNNQVSVFDLLKTRGYQLIPVMD